MCTGCFVCLAVCGAFLFFPPIVLCIYRHHTTSLPPSVCLPASFNVFLPSFPAYSYSLRSCLLPPSYCYPPPPLPSQSITPRSPSVRASLLPSLSLSSRIYHSPSSPVRLPSTLPLSLHPSIRPFSIIHAFTPSTTPYAFSLPLPSSPPPLPFILILCSSSLSLPPQKILTTITLNYTWLLSPF